jgi:hypothetical protein
MAVAISLLSNSRCRDPRDTAALEAGKNTDFGAGMMI